jgi:cyclophilin family peptidyl-prolyl cis-trans isomerase
MGGTSIYGEKFDDEFDSSLKNNKYTISMANA